MTQNLQKLRDDALQIFRAALARAMPQNSIPRLVSRQGDTLEIDGEPYYLPDYEHVYVIAFGKAAAGMFQAVYKLLKDYLNGAVVISNALPNRSSLPSGRHLRYFEGSHPLPSEQNVRAAEQVIDMCRAVQSGDLVLFLISGGGSALLFAPKPGIRLNQYQSLVDDLMKQGANINDLNTIRIVLSQVKGGQLLNYLPEDAKVVNLIISDVIGDPPAFIASGPTVFSKVDTPAQRVMMAKSILEKYQLYRKYLDWLSPVLQKNQIRAPVLDPETYFVGSNRLALLAAKKKARQLGYNTVLLTTQLEGESRVQGHLLGTIILESIESHNPAAPPCCILSGGETTVTVTGEGVGGRNQELALGAADILRDAESGLLLSAGTDGIDGPTDAAGAIVESTTAFRAVHEGVSIKDALYNNDSYAFFKALNDLIVTGPTGTNVMDIQVGLAGK